ncbi:hypothetical protein D3C78_1863920 [compost metagenome]
MPIRKLLLFIKCVLLIADRAPGTSENSVILYPFGITTNLFPTYPASSCAVVAFAEQNIILRGMNLDESAPA